LSNRTAATLCAAHPGREAHTQASVASKAKAMHSFRGSPGTGVSWIVFLCRLTALRMVRVYGDTTLWRQKAGLMHRGKVKLRHPKSQVRGWL